jgi:hypothetical protein
VVLTDLTAESADVQGRLEEPADGGQGLVIAGGVQVQLDPVQYLLGGG